MKVPQLALTEWLNRLGVKRPGWAPEMAEMIQPVQVVSDASSLTSPLLPPTALAGGEILAAALRFSAFEFQSRAPGGCFVRTLRLTANAATTIALVVRSTPLTFVTLVTPTRYALTPTLPATTSVLRIGDVAALSTLSSDPSFLQPTNAQHVFDDAFYLPPGQFLIGEQKTAAFYIAMSMVWQELADEVLPG